MHSLRDCIYTNIEAKSVKDCDFTFGVCLAIMSLQLLNPTGPVRNDADLRGRIRRHWKKSRSCTAHPDYDVSVHQQHESLYRDPERLVQGDWLRRGASLHERASTRRVHSAVQSQQYPCVSLARVAAF